MITGRQLKLARLALDLSASEVADGAGIGVATLRRMEANFGAPEQTAAKVEQVENFFRARGVEFLEGAAKGIRWPDLQVD